MNALKVICQDCGKVIKEGLSDIISHGQCSPCQDKFLWIEGLDEKELTSFINEKELRRQYA